MDRFLVADSVATTLRRERNNAALRAMREAEARADEAWERLTAHMASIPEYEYERQRRVGARRGHSVDAARPPTHLRRECLLVHAPCPRPL
jgi:hypothetical protein